MSEEIDEPKHGKLTGVIVTVLSIVVVTASLWVPKRYSDIVLTFYILLIVLVVVGALAFIPATIAKRKGYSGIGYYVFGLFFFLPALIVALIVQDKTSAPAQTKQEVKYHVDIAKQELSEGVYREYWTCPDCGKSWYISSIDAKTAKCGNSECGCRVALNKQ